MVVANKLSEEELTQKYYIDLMTQPLKDRQVRYINIGQHEIRLWQEEGGMFQQLTLYKNETLISEVILKTNDNVNVVSYMMKNNEVARMLIQQALIREYLQ